MALASTLVNKAEPLETAGGVRTSQRGLVEQLPSLWRRREMRAELWGPGQARSPGQQRGGGPPGCLVTVGLGIMGAQLK